MQKPLSLHPRKGVNSLMRSDNKKSNIINKLAAEKKFIYLFIEYVIYI